MTTQPGSRLVRDQRPTFGSLLPSAGALEQLKSGKQNSNWCLDAPPKGGGITADTYTYRHTQDVAHKQAVPVNLVHLLAQQAGSMDVICEQPSVYTSNKQLGLDRNSCLPRSCHRERGGRCQLDMTALPCRGREQHRRLDGEFDPGSG